MWQYEIDQITRMVVWVSLTCLQGVWLTELFCYLLTIFKVNILLLWEDEQKIENNSSQVKVQIQVELGLD